MQDNTVNVYLKYNGQRLSELFRAALGEEGGEASQLLARAYGTLEGMFSAPYGELESLVGKRCAVFVKLLASVISRSVTDKFEMGKSHSAAEIVDYFCALLLAVSVENVYAMYLTDRDVVLDVRLVSVGTVNASDVIVRKIVEPALEVGAGRVVLAHNHPGGTARPSKEDVALTRALSETLSYAGLKLEYAVVVSGGEYDIISPSDKTELASDAP